jgi:hypothetical protein
LWWQRAPREAATISETVCIAGAYWRTECCCACRAAVIRSTQDW